MRTVCGEGGAALVTALLLTLLSLIIATALLYSVTMETKATASQKRYKSALAAAHGGLEVLTREIVPRIFNNESFDAIRDEFNLINLQFVNLHQTTDPTNFCMQQKLRVPTAQWSVCAENRKGGDTAVEPDLTFNLKGGGTEPDFKVVTKISDTVPGNTFLGSINLDAGSSVVGNDDTTHPEHVPYLYTIGVQGEREGETREKARLSVLYAY